MSISWKHTRLLRGLRRNRRWRRNRRCLGRPRRRQPRGFDGTWEGLEDGRAEGGGESADGIWDGINDGRAEELLLGSRWCLGRLRRRRSRRRLGKNRRGHRRRWRGSLLHVVLRHVAIASNVCEVRSKASIGLSETLLACLDSLPTFSPHRIRTRACRINDFYSLKGPIAETLLCRFYAIASTACTLFHTASCPLSMKITCRVSF
jgi:hypothetical protein